jgi:hypothetical protein
MNTDMILMCEHVAVYMCAKCAKCSRCCQCTGELKLVTTMAKSSQQTLGNLRRTRAAGT